MSDTPYLGQTTDQILGQEFLTWLWFRADTNNRFITTDKQSFDISMERRVVVQGGEGDNIETASASGAMSELREARLGLATGKKVTRATVRLSRDPEEWLVSLKAEDFTLNGLKTPTVTKETEDDEPDALFYEKIHLIELALSFLDTVYKEFLSLRTTPEKWSSEVKEINTWIMQEG